MHQEWDAVQVSPRDRCHRHLRYHHQWLSARAFFGPCTKHKRICLCIARHNERHGDNKRRSGIRHECHVQTIYTCNMDAQVENAHTFCVYHTAATHLKAEPATAKTHVLFYRCSHVACGTFFAVVFVGVTFHFKL